jgi:hypothetical protein
MVPPLPQDPVFIVGYPRSGTTLLQRFLATQPGFRSLPETHFFSVIEGRLRLGAEERVAASQLGALRQAVEEKMESRLTEAEARLLAREAEQGRLTSKTAFEFLVSRRLSPPLGEGPWRWVEKTPTHANFIGRILGLYPRAQVIHVLRHPVPAILSRRRNFPFNRETPLERLAEAWNRMQENVEAGRRSFPDRILTLRYEDLIADADAHLRAVEAFLCARFASGRLELTGAAPADEHLFLPSETWKRRDRSDRVACTNERYRLEADPADVERIEAVVGQAMWRCGYAPFPRAGGCEGQ